WACEVGQTSGSYEKLHCTDCGSARGARMALNGRTSGPEGLDLRRSAVRVHLEFDLPGRRCAIHEADGDEDFLRLRDGTGVRWIADEQYLHRIRTERIRAGTRHRVGE